MISSIFVPFKGNPKSNLYIIGEAPGEEEEIKGEPFVGIAGQTLDAMCMSKGIIRSEPFYCNISHYRPSHNNFDFLVNTPQLRDGVAEVTNLILANKPNLCILLGAKPLEHLLQLQEPSIHAYRGSILNLAGVKCIPTFHPAYISRHDTSPIDNCIWDLDWDRIREEKEFPELKEPNYNFIIDPSWELVHEYGESEYLVADIENVKYTFDILCISFARSPDESIIFDYDKSHVSTWEKVEYLLACKTKKVFHNGAAHDLPILKTNGHTINNYTDDTIIQAHIIEPEFPRDLGYLASIWTRQKYYKQEGRSNIPLDAKGWGKKHSTDKRRLLVYCGTDTCVTYRVFLGQKEIIESDPDLLSAYLWEMQCHPMAVDFTMNGLLVDQGRLAELKVEIENDWLRDQLLLESLTQKKTNVNSPKLLSYLYDELKLPERYKDKKRTADDDAIVSLLSYAKQHMVEMKRASSKREWTIKFYILQYIHRIRKLLKRKGSYIDMKLSEDGRVRGVHKIPGTTTGRWSVAKYMDKTGINLQTVPRD